MNKKHNKYEICIVSNHTTNIDDIESIVNAIKNIPCTVDYYCEVGRFDTCYKIKGNNKMTIFQIDVCIDTIEQRKAIHKILLSSVYVLRYTLINKRNISKKFDYKDPIKMKKFTFETYGIMPRELTLLTAKDQREYSRAVKIAKTLSIVGYKDY